MEIKITYDGRVGVSRHSLRLGDCPIEEIVYDALGIDSTGYQEINAAITIIIDRKPDSPLIRVFHKGDE